MEINLLNIVLNNSIVQTAQENVYKFIHSNVASESLKAILSIYSVVRTHSLDLKNLSLA